MGDPRLDNEARYDRLAPRYALLLDLASFGGIRRLYRAVARELAGLEGTVVEVGCGPATVTPYLRRALGGRRRILGVDLSGAMVARARARAEREGWTDVAYEKADVADWNPPAPVDAVVFCLVLSGLRGPLDVLDRALGWLVPGGRVVVCDSFLRPGHPWTNRVVRAKAPAVGAVPEDLPLESVRERLAEPRTRSLLGGTYLVVSGRRSP